MFSFNHIAINGSLIERLHSKEKEEHHVNVERLYVNSEQQLLSADKRVFPYK